MVIGTSKVITLDAEPGETTEVFLDIDDGEEEENGEDEENGVNGDA
ncbi:hypothetical protein [Alkalilimnicola ehrlichii]